MDWTETFYQELDSEELLQRHGPQLAIDALAMQESAPGSRFAGLIFLPDSDDALAFRRALAKVTGERVPDGIMVGLCPRLLVEPILATQIAREQWQEEPWQDQAVLPVLVSARDGIRLGLFRLPAPADGAAGD